MQDVMVLLFLTVNAWWDWREKKILLWSVAAALAVNGILILGGGGEWHLFPASLAMTAFFGGVSFLTHGALGMGDVLVMFVMGIFLEFREFLMTVMSGLFLAAFYSGGCLVFRKKKRESEIPFVPFLLFGYVGGFWIWK